MTGLALLTYHRFAARVVEGKKKTRVELTVYVPRGVDEASFVACFKDIGKAKTSPVERKVEVIMAHLG